ARRSGGRAPVAAGLHPAAARGVPVRDRAVPGVLGGGPLARQQRDLRKRGKSMLSRFYLVLGGILVAGYAYTALAGVEFTNPRRHRVPVLVAAGMGSPGSGRTSSHSGGGTYYGHGGGGGITGGK